MPSSDDHDDKKQKGLEWKTAKLATEVPKLHTSPENTIMSLAQESTKVLRNRETVMQQSKSRLKLAFSASTDPYTGSVSKLEASSPSKGPGAVQQELQECSDEDEILRMNIYDIA